MDLAEIVKCATQAELEEFLLSSKDVGRSSEIQLSEVVSISSFQHIFLSFSTARLVVVNICNK